VFCRPGWPVTGVGGNRFLHQKGGVVGAVGTGGGGGYVGGVGGGGGWGWACGDTRAWWGGALLVWGGLGLVGRGVENVFVVCYS